MKIVYCINCVSYVGGTQSVTVTKANALAEIEGNQVYIIVTDLPIEPVFKINPKVHLIDLKVCYYQNESTYRFVRFWQGIKKHKLHKEKLTEVLNEIEPDVVISTGWSEKRILPKIRYKRKPVLIRELHYATHYRILNSSNTFSKLLNRCVEWYDYTFSVGEYDRFVLLTEEDRMANWSNNPRVVVIPNPVKPNNGELSSCVEKSVVSMGRYSYQKNFQSLVRSWRRVVDLHPDWILKLYGPWFNDPSFTKLIETLSLSRNVSIMGSTSQVFQELAKSSIFAFSSRFEGLPLVLIEAMSVGLPLVSYQCPCGPKDIIEDGKNGFLVPLNDEEYMANRICWLIDHEEERKIMGQNAFEMSKRYKIDNITSMWMNLFTSLIAESTSRS